MGNKGKTNIKDGKHLLPKGRGLLAENMMKIKIILCVAICILGFTSVMADQQGGTVYLPSVLEAKHGNRAAIKATHESITNLVAEFQDVQAAYTNLVVPADITTNSVAQIKDIVGAQNEFDQQVKQSLKAAIEALRDLAKEVKTLSGTQ